MEKRKYLITDVKKLPSNDKDFHVLVNKEIEIHAVLNPKDKRYGEVFADYNQTDTITEDYVKSIIKEFMELAVNVMQNATNDMKNLTSFQLADKYGAVLTPHENFDYAQSAKYYSLKKSKFAGFFLD